MAKSLRSKWRRKMKAEKRVRYGKKENDRLLKMLTEAGDYQMLPEIKEEPVDTPQPIEVDNGEIIEEIGTKSASSQRSYSHTDNENRKRSKSRHDRRRLSRKSRRDAVSDSESENENEEEVEEDMDTTKDKVERVYNKRTKRDQYGQYPSWFSHARVKKHKKRNKRLVSRARKLKSKKKV